MADRCATESFVHPASTRLLHFFYPASPCLLPLASLPMRGGTRNQGPTGSPAQRPTDTRPGGSPSTQTKNQKWILTSNKCPLSGRFVENDYVSVHTRVHARETQPRTHWVTSSAANRHAPGRVTLHPDQKAGMDFDFLQVSIEWNSCGK